MRGSILPPLRSLTRIIILLNGILIYIYIHRGLAKSMWYVARRDNRKIFLRLVLEASVGYHALGIQLKITNQFPIPSNI